MRAFKDNLKNYIHDDDDLNIIRNVVSQTNIIVTHVYFLLKLVLLKKFDREFDPEAPLFQQLESSELSEKAFIQLSNMIINLLTGAKIMEKSKLALAILP